MARVAELALRVRLLGPLTVWDGRGWRSVAATKQRALLAILVLYRGVPVDRDWLVETLWDAEPPATAARIIPHYVWRLRALLLADPDCRLVATTGGYQLVLPPGSVDVEQFADLVAEGRLATSDPALALARFTAALGLWRGTALADVRSVPLLVRAGERLDQERQAVREGLAEAQLALGRPADAVAALTALTEAEPYREGPWRLLMLALDQTGRRPEALAAYRRMWRIWTDDLGIEPGPVLRELQHALLADEPAGLADPAGPAGPRRRARRPRARDLPRPAQLPPDVGGFAGRAKELEQLDLLTRTGGTPAVVISAIAGTAGVGKTALAVHWGHRVADRFPDGHLYVNLRGFDPTVQPTAPAEAIRGFLQAFAVPPQRVPSSVDAQAALYGSLLAGKRVLVVLDNARDADQVRPLLPGAPGCLAVVTSRNPLTGLVAVEGARPLALDLLAATDARALLVARLGADRVAAEPAAVGEIITRCARLPLALAVAAARAATMPGRTLAALAGELADARASLDPFAGDDQASNVRAVFSCSYRTLSEPAARLFRLLGLHSGPDVAAPAVASLAATGRDDVHPLLAELADANLVVERVPGRYTLHDLLRTYAAELARAIEPETDRWQATARLLDHYLHTGYRAAALLNPHRDQVTVAPARGGVTPEAIADYDDAVAWFTAEHPVVLTAIEVAADSGFDTQTWQLAWTISTFLDWRGLWHQWAATQYAALAAATRLADRRAQAGAQRALGGAYTRMGRYDEAHRHLDHALGLFVELDDGTGQATIHLNIAGALEFQGRHEEALQHDQQALALYRAGGHRLGEANALNAVGWCHARLGQHRQALTHCQQALALHEMLGNRLGMAYTWDSLGYAHHRLALHEQAIASYRRALDLYRSLSNRYYEADALHHIGETYEAADDREAAREAWTRALEILDELDHPDAEQVQAKLDKLAAA